MMEPVTNYDSVRFTYCVLPPFVEQRIENGQVILGGFMPDIVRAVANWMKFTPIFIPEPNNKFGTFINGTWTGMPGMIARNEVELSMSPVLPRDNFIEHAVYTNPITVEEYCMLAGKEVHGAGFFLYFSVLTSWVWITIGLALIITGVTSAAAFFNIVRSSKKRWSQIASEYIWAYFAYMMQQDVSEKWTLKSTKRLTAWILPVIRMAWVIGVAFLVMNTFRSGLFSKLTIVKLVPIIDTMMDFVTKTHVKTISAQGIELQVALQGSEMEIFDRTWERVENNLIDPKDIFSDATLTEVEKGKLSLIHGFLVVESVLSGRFQKKAVCNFQIGKQHFFTFPLVCPMSRRLSAAFREKYNLGITRLNDADIVGKWFKPMKRDADLCQAYSENNLTPISIQNLYGVLVLWAGGVILSTITLLIEISMSSYRNGKNKDSKQKHHLVAHPRRFSRRKRNHL